MKDTRKVLSGQWIVVLNDGTMSHLKLTENVFESREWAETRVAEALTGEKFANVKVEIRQRRRGDLPWLCE